jgi:CBS domain-containing protein
MRVEQVMSQNPVCCTPDDTSAECAKLMAREDVGFIPIVESQDTRRLVGVVTDRDLCIAIVAEGRDPGDAKVEECMTDEVISVAPGDSFDHVLGLMRQHRIRRVCVADENGALVGVVALADIAKAAAAGEVKETVARISEPTR